MTFAQLSTGTHVVIYARKSTKDGGRSEASQVESCKTEAADRDWDVRQVFRDNVGASRHSKGDRPDYEAMTAYITTEKPDVLMLWEVSRADRKLRTWMDTVDLCKATGTHLYILKDDRLYNPNKAGDRRSLLMDGLDAEYESEKTSERTKREMARNATAGRPHGRLLFGYRRQYDNGKLVGQVIDETQAAVVREAFERASVGVGVLTIVADFNSRGIAGTTGGTWNEKTMRRLLTNPGYIGMRIHIPKDDRKAGITKGTLTKATWPAIVEEDTFYEVGRILADPNRRTQFDSKVKYLLSGIAKCGVCGSGLRVRKSAKTKALSYQCVDNWCVSIRMTLLDEYVTQEVKARFVYLDTHHEHDADAEAAREKAKLEVEDLTAYLTQFTKDAVSQRLSAAQVASVVQEVQNQINDAERRSQATSGPTKLVRVLSTDPARFDASGTEVKRESIRAVADYIGVLPYGRTFHTYDVAERVVIEWTETRLSTDPNS